MTRFQREADRLRAMLWSHGINPVSNISGTTGSNSLVAKSSQNLGKGVSVVARREPNAPQGRRREKHSQKEAHRLKKLAPLSHLGGASSFGVGSSSSKVSGAVIGFRNRVGDIDSRPREFRHQ